MRTSTHVRDNLFFQTVYTLKHIQFVVVYIVTMTDVFRGNMSSNHEKLNEEEADG